MNPFISIGIALVTGVFCGKAMNKIKMPAVAGYIIAGLILGISGFKIINNELINNLSFISDFALSIIAFNIGSELELSIIKQLGKTIFLTAFFEAIMAFIFVMSATLFITHDMALALILGSVSAATAPAATVLVLREYNSRGPLTSTLLGVVAVDDAICLVIYALSSAVAKVYVNHETITIQKVLFLPMEEILLSIVVGSILGIFLSYLLRISTKNTEMLPFIIGTLLAADGIAMRFELSPLLTAMSLGIMVANLAVHKRKAFENIENFSPPLVAAFFILAGSRLDVRLLPEIGLLGVAYLLFRIFGKLTGASLGASLAKAPLNVKKYLGLGLLSQVGVAVGLAITVSREFAGTSLGSIVVTILLATTIITEIVGPMATKHAILKAGEAQV